MTVLESLRQLCNSSLIACCRLIVSNWLRKIKRKVIILKCNSKATKDYAITDNTIINNKIAIIESYLDVCQAELDTNIFEQSFDILTMLENDLANIIIEDIVIKYDKVNFLKHTCSYKAIQNKVFTAQTKNELTHLLLQAIELMNSILSDIGDAIPQSQDKFNIGDTLFIYKGNIRCHKDRHKIIQATAILHNQSDNEIKLNVEYCTECKKFFLAYTLFEHYREQYGALIGNLRLVKNGEFTGSYELAQESPLHIIGYNVGKKDDFTETERHYILARVLYGKIMTKGEIIKYLSFFIHRNGAKKGNELAVTKWKNDLTFVQEYDINIQPRTIISQIKRY